MGNPFGPGCSGIRYRGAASLLLISVISMPLNSTVNIFYLMLIGSRPTKFFYIFKTYSHTMHFSKLLLFLLMFSCIALAQEPQTGSDVVALMHKKYYLGPCKCYTFSQKNSHYRNDSLIRHSEWHEAIEYPDKFRINFGDKAEGSFIVFKHDSAFTYKKNTLHRARPDTNNLLLLIGGMYYRKLDDVLHRLKKKDYKLNVLSTQMWNGREVYVIGAKQNDLKSNQLWVDKRMLITLRIIEKLGTGDLMDMRFEAHEPVCKGFIETKVSFRRNGKLEQVEEYYNIKKAEQFPEK